MQPASRCLVSVIAIFASLNAVSGRADIGVNFGSYGPNPTLVPTDIAGVPGYAQANYNNVSSAASNVVLKDHTGANTTATLTSTGASFTRLSDVPTASPDEVFNLGVSMATTVGGPFSFTVNNIPYANYDLIVYVHGIDGGDGANGAYTAVTVGGTTIYSESPSSFGAGYIDGNAATPFTYGQAGSTSLASPSIDANYIVFDGLTGPTLNIAVTSSFNPAAVNGLQIIAVPEPASVALASTALIALLSLRRRLPATAA